MQMPKVVISGLSKAQGRASSLNEGNGDSRMKCKGKKDPRNNAS